MPPLCAVLLLFSKVYGLFGENVVQPDGLVTAQLGETVMLRCFFPVRVTPNFSWFKQPLGKKPQLLARIWSYESETTFYNEFKNSKRFSAKAVKGSFNLTVSQVESSDSATYYCSTTGFNEISFGGGTTLMVMDGLFGENVVQPDGLVTAQLGETVMLPCFFTVQDEPSFSWFKQPIGQKPQLLVRIRNYKSAPTFYNEFKNSKRFSAKAAKRSFNLTVSGVEPSDSATYYCAITHFKNINFGDGTTLMVTDSLFGENVVQPDGLVTAQLGETVMLPCFFPVRAVPNFSWLKQPLGQKPQLLARIWSYETDPTFYNEFKNSKRFSAKAAKGSFNLTVSGVEPSDSATYYCALAVARELSFGNGTTLMVTGSESHSRTVVLQQPESESVQPGDSVTLQCTVHTETCVGEHSVYWFRQGSGESPPGIISTHGTRSDECQRSSGAVSPTQSCVYNFPKRNLSPSDAGTYYCAVATCGEILFGNVTKLHFEGNKHLPLYCLAGGLTLSVILNVVLALKWRKSSEICKGSTSNSQVSREDLSSKQCQDEAMNYAALTFTTKKPNVRRNKREVEKETVYSDMRFRDRE
ncbi:uncharacterized protein LOC118223771 isoform X1 [Anguilla anguilla]|uniref:uncharacterized protein LOC118223771 isoform X1 n=1 Tax=Anguilla anguilla TaxID=7936 RepID=UPI0015B1BF0A|nr:uncharacterized protein LOC118223771 isoform X1 [Anguilla anguilla]